MSGDRHPGEQLPEDPAPDRQRSPGESSGCWSAFVILWGIAFLLVGLLITAVSGFCGFAVLQDGNAARDFAGMLLVALIIGIFLCAVGYFLLRGGRR